MSDSQLYDPQAKPVLCPNSDCLKPLEDDLNASAFVVPGRFMHWSYDECGWCQHRYRARRLLDGEIEVEYVGEPLDGQQ